MGISLVNRLRLDFIISKENLRNLNLYKKKMFLSRLMMLSYYISSYNYKRNYYLPSKCCIQYDNYHSQ